MVVRGYKGGSDQKLNMLLFYDSFLYILRPTLAMMDLGDVIREDQATRAEGTATPMGCLQKLLMKV